MNILNELPDIEILERQLAEAEKLASNIGGSLPDKPTTDIEGIFDGNLQDLLAFVRKRVELFQRIDQDVQAETIVQSKVTPGQLGRFEKESLPDWFEYAFDREFEKHVKGFNYLAKKLHQARFSEQVSTA